MTPEPWSSVRTDDLGRGYSAVDLENAQRVSVLGELERKMPGVVGEIASALAAEREAQAKLARLRQQILDLMPGDASAHAFHAARRALGDPDKNTRPG